MAMGNSKTANDSALEFQARLWAATGKLPGLLDELNEVPSA